MTDIQEQTGAKWFAGVMLAMLVMGMGQGFALPVYAEGEEAPPQEEPAPEPQVTEPEPETTTQSETQNSNTDETPGEEGEDGAHGEPIDETPPAEDGEDGLPNEDGGSGEGGESGESAEEAPAPDGEVAEINTGDATAGSTAATGANITDIETDVSTSTASSTPESGGGSGGGSTDVNLTNGLNASTTASSTANTGENTGVDPDGVNIFTGDGISSVFDVLAFNIALVNSFGQIVLLQNPLSDELDLRERILSVFRNLTGQEGTCTLTVCHATNALFNYIGENISDVERNTYAGCNSGENLGESSDGPVLIDAGDCTSSNLTVTIGDLTAVHSTYLIILMNHVGDLSSDIILPEPSFFEALRGGASLGAGSTLAATSTAEATNNATSTASSGSNTAMGTDFSAVESGDADAHAFVGNFANQINPPTCFIISVGGTWTGDVYQMPNGFDRESTPFADIICGRGTGESSGITDYNLQTTNYAKVLVNAIAEATTGGNTAIGQFAGIRSGDAESFLYVLNILNTTLINQDWLFGLFTVSGDWDGDFSFGARPDASPAEQAAGALTSGNSSPNKSGSKYKPAKIVLTKTASVSTATAPSTVDYTITLKNNGLNKVYGALLEDVLSDPTGNVVNTQKWDLGMIQPGEEIIVTYSVEFTGNLLGGEYVNAARLTGRLGPTTSSPSMKPVFTYTSLNLLGGEVLGAESCPAYLTSYITTYGKNDPEQVRLLEVFLRDGRNEQVVPDGTYDAASVAAVKRFQSEHVNDILAPWGIDYPTGHVYFTTRKKINELYCNGAKDFPLSPLQVRQIELYRNGELQPGSTEPVGDAPAPFPWSAIDFPLIAEFNLFQSVAEAATTPPTSAGFFPSSAFSSHPLLTLLRDIFSQIASGFSIEKAQAAPYNF